MDSIWHTTPDDFLAIFSGNATNCQIRWTGKKTYLVYLFRLLTDKKYISTPKGIGRWMIVGSHFIDAHNRLFTLLNSQRIPVKAQQTIEQLIWTAKYRKFLNDSTNVCVAKKICKKCILLAFAWLSVVRKKKEMNILTLKSKMYAQNPCYAYILCSIIIETRPQKGHHPTWQS